MKIKKERILGPFFCITAAVVWGLSFVFQSEGSGVVETFTFNGIRTFLGGIVLLPIVIYNHFKGNRHLEPAEKKKFPFVDVIRGGIGCGIPLFIGGNLQQYAFTDLEAGKVGFITALYMLLVPIFGLFLKQRAKLNVWAGVIFGLIGLSFISIQPGSLTIGTGEIVTMLCAVAFAWHILAIDRFCKKVDNIALSCAQFFVAGGLSIICMFIFETPKIDAIMSVGMQIFYAGVMSCAVAFTFQIFGQKYSEPAVASILLCLESVFSVIFGWLILDQVLTVRERAGCIIMFCGIVLTQIPGSVFDRKKKQKEA